MLAHRVLALGLGVEELLAVLQELAVVALAAEIALGVALVQLDDAVADPLQEAAVVGHHEEGEAQVLHEPLQPEHAFQVQVVGGLVEQQQVRLAQDLGQDGQALAPAAGKFGDLLFGVGEAGFFQPASMRMSIS